MKDQELFELCKQVYEATGWDNTDFWYPESGDYIFYQPEWVRKKDPRRDQPKYLTANGLADMKNNFANWDTPLYTSDYLLEKLPKYLEIHGKRADDYLLYLRPNFNTEKWTAYYHGVGEYMPFFIDADTPLKALLKLTIALKKEGLL